jgi:oxygen-independent coproporphyrinogen-3 oxidase
MAPTEAFSRAVSGMKTASQLSESRMVDAFAEFQTAFMGEKKPQEPAAWRAELRRALEQGAEHLSLYQLTIEDGTPFAALHRAGKLKVPDAELARVMGVTQEACSVVGLPAYEVSEPRPARG